MELKDVIIITITIVYLFAIDKMLDKYIKSVDERLKILEKQHDKCPHGEDWEECVDCSH
jgi:hypothetical protein